MMVEKKAAHLECEHSLPLLEPASGDGAASTLTKTTKLDDLVLFASRVPALIIKIIHIEGPALLQTQLVQIREESIDAVIAVSTLAIRVH